jgi:hypothetical protein
VAILSTRLRPFWFNSRRRYHHHDSQGSSPNPIARLKGFTWPWPLWPVSS